jgi:hypothetical protein
MRCLKPVVSQSSPPLNLWYVFPIPSKSKLVSDSKVHLDVANPAVLPGLGRKPVVAIGKTGTASNSNSASMPAKVDFGHMPKNTVPCDGLMVRETGDLVEMCIKAEMFDQRPKNTHVCLFLFDGPVIG